MKTGKETIRCDWCGARYKPAYAETVFGCPTGWVSIVLYREIGPDRRELSTHRACCSIRCARALVGVRRRRQTRRPK